MAKLPATSIAPQSYLAFGVSDFGAKPLRGKVKGRPLSLTGWPSRASHPGSSPGQALSRDPAAEVQGRWTLESKRSDGMPRSISYVGALQIKTRGSKYSCGLARPQNKV